MAAVGVVARYPITEKKCLAVVYVIKRFKLYLISRRFTLQTDHKPLKYLKDAVYQNDRVIRWALTARNTRSGLRTSQRKRIWEQILEQDSLFMSNCTVYVNFYFSN